MNSKEKRAVIYARVNSQSQLVSCSPSEEQGATPNAPPYIPVAQPARSQEKRITPLLLRSDCAGCIV